MSIVLIKIPEAFNGRLDERTHSNGAHQKASNYNNIVMHMQQGVDHGPSTIVRDRSAPERTFKCCDVIVCGRGQVPLYDGLCVCVSVLVQTMEP